MASYFPRFIIDEQNENIYEEVSKGEFSSMCSSFKKYESPGPDG